MKRLKLPEKDSQSFNKTYIVICPKCNVCANLQRAPIAYRYIYECPICKAKVAAHFGNLAPMGYPADKKTRLLRQKAHFMLNNFAKAKEMSMKESYIWLSDKLNKPLSDTHIGYFSVDELHKVIDLCNRAIKAVNKQSN